ncbi:MAG: hypothetical protein ACQEQG_09270 [Bacillota bacterium]
MKKVLVKKMGLILVVLLMVVGLTGCLGSDPVGDVADDDLDFGGDAYFELAVSWDTLENDSVSSLSDNFGYTTDDLKEPTHVGARLVYPDENADFSQMTTRETAENEGIITMKVPHGEAVLQVVVVHVNASSNFATLLGGAKIEELKLRGNQITKINLESLDIKPFTTRWADGWEEKFDADNLALISTDDIISDDHFHSYNYHVKPTIEMEDPIYSKFIPDDMQVEFMGKFVYKRLDDTWTHDTFAGNDNNIGCAPIRINDEMNKFISKDREEFTVFEGWLSFELYGKDQFNLPDRRYRPISSPYHRLNDTMQPTQFKLEFK